MYMFWPRSIRAAIRDETVARWGRLTRRAGSATGQTGRSSIRHTGRNAGTPARLVNTLLVCYDHRDQHGRLGGIRSSQESKHFPLRQTQADPLVGRDSMLTLPAPCLANRRHCRVQISPEENFGAGGALLHRSG